MNSDCWESTPRISKWLAANGMSADGGYAYFVKKTAHIASVQGRRPVQWSEVFDHFKAALPKEVIVHVWKAVTNVTEVLADGYNVLRNVGYDKTSWCAATRAEARLCSPCIHERRCAIHPHA